MTRQSRTVRTIATTAFVAAATLLAGSARAQTAPVVLLLDSNAIAANKAPNMFTAADINATIAAAGVRDPMPFFMRHLGQNVVLPGGPAGHEGWFAIGSMPASWKSATGQNDQPQNFVLAGAGLGSPDATGNRTSLLTSVPSLTPLDLAKLQTLTGKQVCAVVFANQIPWSGAGTSLAGGTSGVVAFSILSVGVGSAGLPAVTVTILDDGPACGGSLSLAAF